MSVLYVKLLEYVHAVVHTTDDSCKLKIGSVERYWICRWCGFTDWNIVWKTYFSLNFREKIKCCFLFQTRSVKKVKESISLHQWKAAKLAIYIYLVNDDTLACFPAKSSIYFSDPHIKDKVELWYNDLFGSLDITFIWMLSTRWEYRSHRFPYAEIPEEIVWRRILIDHCSILQADIMRLAFIIGLLNIFQIWEFIHISASKALGQMSK